MNVNDINSVLYNSALGNVNFNTNNLINNVTNTGSSSVFDATLNEEISKITEFKELAGVLNKSVLGNMIANASDTDLATLSEDLLGSKGGREVLAKLMDGHFNSIVMSDPDDNENEGFNRVIDSFSQSVSESQTLLNNLESLMETLNPGEDEE